MSTLPKFAHLVGLEFEWARQDCFTLARDFYQTCLKMDFPDFARPENWPDDRPDLKLMETNYPKMGFVTTTERREHLRFGDVILMSIRSTFASHMGVIVGPSEILHHPYNALSRVEKYRGLWADRTVAVIRHPQCPDYRAMGTASVVDYMIEHKRKAYSAATG